MTTTISRALGISVGSSLMMLGASGALADDVVKIGHAAPLTGVNAH